MPMQHDFSQWYDMFLDGYNDFGKADRIHTLGVPGLGTGSTGTVHVCHDPYEFMKVIRGEGKYPSGSVEIQWVNRDYFDRRGMTASADFTGRGEGWRQQRQLLARDLMTPTAYKSYSNAIARAARFASAAAKSGQQHTFLSRASFDMFGAAFFGEQLMSANEETLTPENKKFCESAEIVLEAIMTTSGSPQEYIAHVEGKLTPTTEAHNAAYDYCNEHATRIIHAFIDKKNDGTLTEDQKNSYLFAALNRQEHTDTKVDSLVEVLNFLLLAAVDTTSAYLHWVLMALATHQDVQQKVFDELTTTLGDSELSRDLISQKQWLPYLHKVQREVHRQRPALAGVAKQTTQPITLCGYEMQKDDAVWLDSYSIQNDIDIMPDADVFRPDRWNTEEVSWVLVMTTSAHVSLRTCLRASMDTHTHKLTRIHIYLHGHVLVNPYTQECVSHGSFGDICTLQTLYSLVNKT